MCIYNVHVCTHHIFPLNACVYTYSCTSGVSWVGLGRSIHMVGGIQPPRLSETAAGLNHWMFLSSYQCILILVWLPSYMVFRSWYHDHCVDLWFAQFFVDIRLPTYVNQSEVLTNVAWFWPKLFFGCHFKTCLYTFSSRPPSSHGFPWLAGLSVPRISMPTTTESRATPPKAFFLLRSEAQALKPWCYLSFPMVVCNSLMLDNVRISWFCQLFLEESSPACGKNQRDMWF